MSNPKESIAGSSENGSRNPSISDVLDDDSASQISKKYAARPRFNWKHRYRTSHARTGSEGQVRNSLFSCSCKQSLLGGQAIDEMGVEDDATSYDDVLSRVDSPDILNPKSTPSRRTKKTSKDVHGISESERLQRNFHELKEQKAQNRFELHLLVELSLRES